MLNNKLIDDERLSNAEYRLMSLILRNADTYVLNIDSLMYRLKIGRTKFQQAKTNMKRMGYLKSTKIQGGYHWEVNETVEIHAPRPSVAPNGASLTSVTNNTNKNNKELLSVEPTGNLEKSGQDEKEDFFKEISEVYAYLSQKVKKNIRPTSKHLGARMREGLDVWLAKQIIDMKFDEWHDNKTMEKYLRPDTLFNAEKFEKYLDEYESSDRKRKSKLSYGETLTVENMNDLNNDDELLIDFEPTPEAREIGFEDYKSLKVKIKVIRGYIRLNRGTSTYRGGK